MDADGEQVGVGSEIRRGTAYVKPDRDLADELEATFEMNDTDESLRAAGRTDRYCHRRRDPTPGRSPSTGANRS